jgi:cysteine desulfurase
VQAAGKLAFDVTELGVDLLTISAHKMHGPKGVGALYVRRGARLRPLFHGGEHERGLRAGTENVAAIVGLGAAAEYAIAERSERSGRWGQLTRHLVREMRAAIPDITINSPDEQRVLNTVNVTMAGVEGEAVVLGLDLAGVAVATGSACSSGAAESSHVLLAMGLSREHAESSIRISLHAHSSLEEIDACVRALARVVKKLRTLSV